LEQRLITLKPEENVNDFIKAQIEAVIERIRQKLMRS